MDNLETLEILGGNTINPPISNKKQCNQLLHWFFTWNNYEKKDIETLETFFKTYCNKYCFQEETGENGTPHLQGVISLKKRERWTAFGLPKAIHWEKVAHLTKAYEYCSKTETRTGNIYALNYKITKPIKIITNLYDWQKKIEKIYLEEPDDRRVYWFYDESGNIGKTAFIKYMVVTYKCLFCSGGKYQDIMNLVFNQNMDDCKAVLFNIPRANKGHISYASLEAIKDGIICNTKYETGVKVFNPPHLFVFANFPPENTDELSLDRWNIINLEQQDLT